MTVRLRGFLILLLQCLILQTLTACTKVSEEAQQHALQKPEANKTEAGIINLTQQARKAANIETFIVSGRSPMAEITSTGEIKADEGRVFHINSIVSGRVVKDNVSLGQMIKEGQVLAIVQNLEVSKAYADYIHQAHKNEIDIKEAQEKLDLYKKTLERAKKLFDEGIGAQKEVLAAQNQVNLTEIALKGLKEHAVHIRSEAEALLSAYGVELGSPDCQKVETGSPLKSPRAGVVIQKNITMGDVVTAEQPLYVVADLSQVWLDVAVYDKDLDSIKIGQKVEFSSDSLAKRTFKGSISYIPPSASNIRTFTARAVLTNPGLVLKPGMFGRVRIENTAGKTMPYLPDSALQKYGNETFVFKVIDDKNFEKAVLSLGQRLGDGYLIDSGIKVGEQVVGQGSFALKSELLKSETGQED